MALEAGMTNEEIQNMLAGVSDDVPEEEIYGIDQAKGILAAIRIMMFGNAAGIAWGSFVNRFKKDEEADERSSLLYEIGIMLATIVFMPIALVHALLAKVFGISTINFKAETVKQ